MGGVPFSSYHLVLAAWLWKLAGCGFLPQSGVTVLSPGQSPMRPQAQVAAQLFGNWDCQRLHEGAGVVLHSLCSPTAGECVAFSGGDSFLFLCCYPKTANSYKVLSSSLLRPGFLHGHSPHNVPLHLGLWLLFAEEVRAGYLYSAMLEPIDVPGMSTFASFWDRGFHVLELVTQADLAGQWAKGLCLSSSEVTSLLVWFCFRVGSRDQIQALMFQRQVLYGLSHLPSP